MRRASATADLAAQVADKDPARAGGIKRIAREAPTPNR